MSHHLSIHRHRAASIARSIVTVFAILSAWQHATADIVRMNGQIDHLLYPKHDPKLVILGRITAIKDSPPSPTPTLMHGPDAFDLTFQVDTVLFGPPQKDALNFHVSSFDWPEVLVPRKVGSYCIFIVRNDSGNAPNIEAVIPAQPGTFATAKDYAELRPILAAQILAQLAPEKDILRQWLLLREVAPILQREQLPAIEPFLASKNIWVRRAALGAITWTDLDPKRIAEVDQDIRDFFTTTQQDDLVRDLFPGSAYSPYALLTEAYFFVQSGWSAEEGARLDPLAPIFRHIAADARIEPNFRWYHGYQPLCGVGTTDDAKVLWECYNTPDAAFRKAVLERPSNRQSLLMSLSRLYDLKLLNWVESDFLEKETEQVRTVRRALVEQQVIKE